MHQVTDGRKLLLLWSLVTVIETLCYLVNSALVVPSNLTPEILSQVFARLRQ